MLRASLFIALISLVAASALAQDQVKLDSLQLQLASARNDSSKVKTLLEISSQYYNYNYSQSARFSKQARDLAVQLGLNGFVAKADRNLGYLLMVMGDYKNSPEHYFKALKYYETVADTNGIIAINNNLGTLYDRLREFDKALTYYFKARDLLNGKKVEHEKMQRLPVVYNNIANIYQSKGDIKSALQYYEKALELGRKSDNKQIQGTTCNNLGKLYLNDIKEFDKAYQYLEEGLRIREELGDPGEIAKSTLIIADYHFQREDFVAARKAAKQTILIGGQIGSLETQKSAYRIMSRIEEALGKYSESLDDYKTFKKLSDSIQDQQANAEITRLQLQYDFEKAERAHELERSQTRLRYITAIIVLGVGLILAILIAVIVRSRARQTELKRKNLAQDVEIKNKELTTNVMYLIRKNELINSVAERLLKLQSRLLPEQHKVIQEIIIDLQREADSDTWKEFEMRFHQVHSDFYSTLRKLYPTLSPADEKLCAFLRLNMSSKEIAAITQQSIKSIEVARARLRKKLDLTNTTSNLVTHLSNL